MTTTVVLTREGNLDDEIAAALAGAARVLRVELTSTEYVGEATVRQAVQNGPAPYATVAITSARAARYLPSVLDQCANDAVIAVVGPATHAAVLAAGVGDHAIVGGPAAIDAAALATVINRGPVLHLGAATPRAELADGVAMRGLSFTHVTCYSTRPRVLDGLEQEKLNLGDIIAISAPSAWQVAKEHVRTSTMIVVPGATTADAVRADHERVQLSATLLTTLQELVGS